jgi:REP element-mobilizing transposase RayT
MPDHLHLLSEGQAEDSDCLRFIKRAKQFSGYHYKARFNRRLWQRYGFGHILRGVERVEDYPYLGSSAYTLEQILEAVQMRDGRYRRSG